MIQAKGKVDNNNNNKAIEKSAMKGISVFVKS